MSRELRACKFEVCGRVQGVYFRKHTLEKALELGVRGYVMNTARGSVVGELQAPEPAYSRMQEWLAHTGSPASRIDKATWTAEKRVPAWTYKNFRIKK